MSKRLTKTEYITVYAIIITLGCFVGGFFLGAAQMKATIKAELAAAAKVEREKAEKEKMLSEQKLYRDQDFIRFYYGAYNTIKECKDSHFAYAEKIRGKSHAEQISMLKELQKSVKEKANELSKVNLPDSSPLLIDAKDAYVKALQAYVAGIDQVLSDNTIDRIDADQFAAAVQLPAFASLWHQADANLYKAFAIWESVYVSKQPMPKEPPANVSAVQWKQYSFLFRNYLSAEYMRQLPAFTPYSPIDLTARLDTVIDSGKMEALGSKDIASAVRILNATDAVRSGDFRNQRNRLYPGMKTPEIPLFEE